MEEESKDRVWIEVSKSLALGGSPESRNPRTKKDGCC